MENIKTGRRRRLKKKENKYNKEEIIENMKEIGKESKNKAMSLNKRKRIRIFIFLCNVLHLINIPEF